MSIGYPQRRPEVGQELRKGRAGNAGLEATVGKMPWERVWER